MHLSMQSKFANYVGALVGRHHSCVAGSVAALAVLTTCHAVAAAPPEQVLVPAGAFTMGSAAGNTDERPEHSVQLDAYFIDKYEVSNADFKLFIDAGGYSNSVYWSSAGWSWRTANNVTLPLYWASGQNNSGPQNPTFPVVGVCWYEAEAYANFVCRRLPTEAEWEKAARGTDLRTYPWGSGLTGARANYSASGDPYEPGLTPIGFFDGHTHPSPFFATIDSPGPYGTYDQSGNAWEWARDWYSSSYYASSPSTNPQGPATGVRRTLRGGARDNAANDLRTFNRGDITPTTRTPTVGFRLAGSATLSGDVLGLTVRRPAESSPSLRPLPDVWVALLRDGTRMPHLSPYPATSASGTFSFTNPQTCGDQVVTSLENDTIKVIMTGSTPPAPCAPIPCLSVPVTPQGQYALRWDDPGTLDAVNAYYLAHDVLREFWAARLGVQVAPVIALHTGDNSARVKHSAGALSSTNGSETRFADGMTQFEDVVYHELSHAVIGKTLGNSVADGTRRVHPEADGIDEGVADYFTAAFTGRPQIYVPGQLDRKLAPLLPLQYTRCETAPGSGQYRYSADAYYGARLVGGALWALRLRLLSEGVPANDIDSWIFAGVRALVETRSVSERTFNNLRHTLRTLGLGSSWQSIIDEVFAARNIQDVPLPLCSTLPVVQNIERIVTSSFQRISLLFSSVPAAASYRVYLRDFESGMGIGLGDLIADGLTDTTFVYEEPDTSRLLAFLVTAVDSTGEEGPASTEVPEVTSITPWNPGDLPRVVRIVPNPTMGAVQVMFTDLRGRPATATVFDVRGRVVRRLIVPEHSLAVAWDGLDGRGHRVPAGVYIVRLQDALSSSTARIAIVR